MLDVGVCQWTNRSRMSIIGIGDDKRGSVWYYGQDNDTVGTEVTDVDLNEGCYDRGLSELGVVVLCMMWGSLRGLVTLSNGTTYCYSEWAGRNPLRNASIDGEVTSVWVFLWRSVDCARHDQ